MAQGGVLLSPVLQMGGEGMKEFGLKCWSLEVQTQSVSHERHHSKLSAPDSPCFAWSALSSMAEDLAIWYQKAGSICQTQREKELDVMSDLQAPEVLSISSSPNILPKAVMGRMGLLWFWQAGLGLAFEISHLLSLQNTDLSLKSLITCSVD